jgi:hypothetical protein
MPRGMLYLHQLHPDPMITERPFEQRATGTCRVIGSYFNEAVHLRSPLAVSYRPTPPGLPCCPHGHAQSDPAGDAGGDRRNGAGQAPGVMMTWRSGWNGSPGGWLGCWMRRRIVSSCPNIRYSERGVFS